MKNPNIIITTIDHAKLTHLINSGQFIEPRDAGGARQLKRELERAKIVKPAKIPADVITLDSRVELLDLDTDETMEYTIVMPADVDISRNKISVLAPIAIGMLGCRVNDVFAQETPRGTCRLKVLRLHFQPEAMGQAPELHAPAV